MSNAAIDYVYAYTRQNTPGAILLLITLANLAGKEDWKCYPSIEKLAELTHMTNRTIHRLIKKLEKAGEIAIERGRGQGKTHTYTILKHADKPDTLSGKTGGVESDLNLTSDAALPDIRSTFNLTSDSEDPLKENLIEPKKISRVRAGVLPELKALQVLVAEDRKSELDSLWDAIVAVWQTKGAQGWTAKLRKFLLGECQIKDGIWHEHQLEQPALAAEVLMFGRWYKLEHPTLNVPTRPETIERYFATFRQWQARQPQLEVIEHHAPVDIDAEMDPAALARRLGGKSA